LIHLSTGKNPYSKNALGLLFVAILTQLVLLRWERDTEDDTEEDTELKVPPCGDLGGKAQEFKY
jgi:hypothetical protein